MITWEGIKEVFFTIGALAGVFALARPWMESRMGRDTERAQRIKSLIDQQHLVDLEPSVYDSRTIYNEYISPFMRLTHERRTNQEGVRFTGPIGRFYSEELDSLLDAYRRFRDYVQVPEWEPVILKHGDDEVRAWQFNKDAFRGPDGVPRDYAEHLHEATGVAIEMREAFYRFQLVSETHLFEVPFARWLLPRRFKKHKVERKAS
jgi:hypothetical protein